MDIPDRLVEDIERAMGDVCAGIPGSAERLTLAHVQLGTLLARRAAHDEADPWLVTVGPAVQTLTGSRTARASAHLRIWRFHEAATAAIRKAASDGAAAFLTEQGTVIVSRKETNHANNMA